MASVDEKKKKKKSKNKCAFKSVKLNRLAVPWYHVIHNVLHD